MSDDDFEIRPGRIRDRSRGQGKARTLKAQLRALSNRAGHSGRSGGSGSRRGTGRLTRGRIASLRATSRASQRRVIVKARIVRHRGSRFTAAPLAQHLTYLKRREQRSRLKQHAQSPQQGRLGNRAGSAEILSKQANRTGCGLDQAENLAQQRRLATA